MSDCNKGLNQIDEEMILTDEVSDEALEAASVAPQGLTAMTSGRMRKPPRREYIADWKRTGSRSNNCRI
jgi:hypothetical protein